METAQAFPLLKIDCSGIFHGLSMSQNFPAGFQDLSYLALSALWPSLSLSLPLLLASHEQREGQQGERGEGSTVLCALAAHQH